MSNNYIIFVKNIHIIMIVRFKITLKCQTVVNTVLMSRLIRSHPKPKLLLSNHDPITISLSVRAVEPGNGR